MINTIYALKNKINNKIYIGQTWGSTQKRWNNGWGYIGSHKIDNAINKYGKENFYYEILAYCENQEISNHTEQFFIKYFDAINNGYNICIGGTTSCMTGRIHSIESKQKMSNSHKGNTAHLGKSHSEKTKQILSQKIKLHLSQNGHPFQGKHHTKDSKNQMSISKKGQRASIATEFKKGQIPHNKGKQLSNDTKNKISNANMLFSIEIQQEICNEYITTKISILKLSKNYKCSATAIRNILKKYNITIRKSKNK